MTELEEEVPKDIKEVKSDVKDNDYKVTSDLLQNISYHHRNLQFYFQKSVMRVNLLWKDQDWMFLIKTSQTLANDFKTANGNK